MKKTYATIPAEARVMYRWYIGFRGEPVIQPIHVVKETEQTYTIITIGWGDKYTEERRMKHGLDLYATWQEAKDALMAACLRRVDSAEANLDRAKRELDAAWALGDRDRDIATRS